MRRVRALAVIVVYESPFSPLFLPSLFQNQQSQAIILFYIHFVYENHFNMPQIMISFEEKNCLLASSIRLFDIDL